MRLPLEIPALALAALAAACSSFSGVSSVGLCPEPKIYTADAEVRAGRELLALPRDSVLAAMIIDYGRERAALRACRRAL